MPDRVSGILLHPSSLPGPFGIGELGDEAVAFLDFLHEAGQRVWQVLPLGPTGYGDSPYQCFSAFAGNPLLVSLELLCRDGLVSRGGLERRPDFHEQAVDFGPLIEWKRPLLAEAFATFERTASMAQRDDLQTFCLHHQGWLPDFALFMALKRANGGRPWSSWDRALVMRRPEALDQARRELSRERQEVEFEQWLFFEQWSALRSQARARGISILGDLPIFVAQDSAEVWAHPEIFHLAADGTPSFQAGVPPDYFSATGQLWGNPLYRWDALARTGYQWWIDRFRAVLTLVDSVRLDHFRGFEAYWEIPGSATTAEHGRWVKGPGAPFFEALRASLGALPIVAEDLGVITPEVEALRDSLGFPGMAILQFAFGSDPKESAFLPHAYQRNKVVYTGTHDNDTVVGWWTGGVGDSTRTAAAVEKEHERARTYLGGDGSEIHWDFVRALFVSVADTVIVPLQDVLGLGSEARMNVPGHGQGNWRWRFRSSDLTAELRSRLRALTEVSARIEERRPDQRAEPAPGV